MRQLTGKRTASLHTVVMDVLGIGSVTEKIMDFGWIPGTLRTDVMKSFGDTLLGGSVSYMACVLSRLGGTGS